MAARGYVTSPEIPPVHDVCSCVRLLYVNLQYVSVHFFLCVQCHQQGWSLTCTNVTLAYS